jgi:hypothetical protein
LLNSGAVYRKYKASAEMSAGGRVYTKDSGPEHVSVTGEVSLRRRFVKENVCLVY